jgi:hypothetical protein
MDDDHGMVAESTKLVPSVWHLAQGPGPSPKWPPGVVSGFGTGGPAGRFTPMEWRKNT